MNTQADVDAILAEPAWALVGLSRRAEAFGALALPRLKEAGYQLFAVNPHGPEAQGLRTWPDLASLPGPVGAALFFTKPEVTEALLPGAAAAGIRKVWLQQGTEGPRTRQLCEDLGLTAVTGHCILMFAGKVDGYHRLHRTLKGWFGGLPR